MRKIYLSILTMFVACLVWAQPFKKHVNYNVNIENPLKNINLGIKQGNPLSRQTTCIDTSMYPVYKLEDGANLDWGIPFAKTNDFNYYDGFYQTYQLDGNISVLGFRVYAITDYDGTPGDGPDMPIVAGIYNVDGFNTPTTAVYTEQTVVVDSGFTYQNIMFSSPVSVSGDFAIGLQIDPALGDANDSVMVWGSQDGWGQGENLAYISYFGNYYNFGDMDFLILPIVQYDIDAAFNLVQECSSITTTNMTQFVGGNGFDISDLYGVSSYQWDLGNGEQRGDVDLEYQYWQGGTYTVTLNKVQYMWTGQCMDSESVTVSVFGIDDVIATDATCGESDASATVMASGGQTPYMYFWTDLNGIPVGTTQSVSGLASGAALITVVDQDGCTRDEGTPINDAGAPSITLTTVNATCNGTNDGSASVDAIGGSTPYTYTWIELESGQYMGNGTSITGLSGGIYVISVVDDLGCKALNGDGVWNPEPIQININTNDVTTIGGNDGQAYANAYGGNWTGFTYEWSGGNEGIPDNNVFNLSAGTYYVTATDGKGCQGVEEFQIFEPTCDNTKIDFWHDAYCDGSNETWVWDNNGPTPFTYLWSNGETNDYVADLVPGEYSITGTDAQGCTDVVYFTVNDPNVVTNFTVTDETCGWQNGEIESSSTGGTPGYNYSWDNGDWGDMIGGLDGGVYNVTVYDNNGCEFYESVTVEGTEQMLLDVSGTDATCGATDGTASVTVTGGASPLTYIWADINGNFLGLTPSITGLQGGAAALVSVVDNEGCLEWDGVAIQNIGAPSVSVTAVSVTGCVGDANGELHAVVAGGTSPYAYQWVNFFNPGVVVGTTASVTGVEAGFYLLTVTDNQMPVCAALSTAELDEPDSVYISIGTNDVTYPMGNDGEAWENWTWGGTSPYTYEWSNGETANWTMGIEAGIHDITITDDNGCQFVEEFEIFAPSCDVSITAEGYDALCFGMSNGSGFAEALGGSGPYDFYWSNGDNSQYAYNLSMGQHNVTVYDKFGCSATEAISVGEPEALSITITSTDEDCGNQDGEATVNVSGGTGPYFYSWNNNYTGETLYNLSNGQDYAVTVYDDNECMAIESVTIEGTDYFGFDVTVTPPACGESDGIAFAGDYFGGSGSGSYTYIWKDLNGNTVSTSSSASGLGVGGILVTISDGTCESTSGQPVSSPGAPTVTVNGSMVACFGDTDGEVVAEANGGATPYTYAWGILNFGSSTTTMLNETSATLTNVGVVEGGVYIVTVYGDDGCGALEGDNVYQPEPLGVSLNVSHVSSNGAADGSVQSTVNGGSYPYYYDWNNGATTADINGLSGDLYSVTVEDDNGCMETTSIVVTEPGVTVSVPCNLTVTLTPSHVSEFGGTDGSVSVSVDGVQGNESYNWNIGESTSGIFDLAAGVYTVTVSDDIDAACFVIETITVTEPDPIVCDLTVTSSSTQENCGKNDGTASVAVTGGTAPYFYYWSTFDNMSSAQNLDAGEYIVTIEDMNLCTETITITVGGEDEDLDFEITVTSPSCGSTDGTAMVVSVTGGSGSGNYTYSWEDLNGNSLGSTSSITGVGGGAVLVTVSDGTCETMRGQGVSEDGAPSITVTGSGVDCYGDTDGSISVTASGGSAPYSYAWGIYDVNSSSTTPLSETGAVLSNVGALNDDQVYLVTVSGNDGCSAVEGGGIDEPEEIQLSISSTSVTSNGAADGTAEVSVNGGTTPYTYNWNSGGNSYSISGLSGALYTVTVTDANGCMEDISVVIEEPGVTTTIPCTVSVTLAATHVTTNGGSNGKVVATVGGDQGSVSYSWSVVGTGNTINGLVAGTYSVTVTDDITAMCTATASVTVNDGPSSIVEFNNEVELNVFPNPNTGIFTYELSGNGKYTINVLNLIGQSVYTESINVADKYVSNIELYGVESGVYFLYVRGDNFEKTSKIIVH